MFYKNIKYKIKDFLNISDKETKGLLVLIILTGCIILIPYFAKIYYLKKGSIHIENINIEDKVFKTYSKNKKKLFKKININKINFKQLNTGTGIKFFLCKRIVSYRNLLGGFYDARQYNEIYKLSKEDLRILKSKCFISPNPNVKKINILKCSFKDLLRHPYISFQQAKLIFRYRYSENLEEILHKVNGNKNKKWIHKVKNYLTLFK